MVDIQHHWRPASPPPVCQLLLIIPHALPAWIAQRLLRSKTYLDAVQIPLFPSLHPQTSHVVQYMSTLNLHLEMCDLSNQTDYCTFFSSEYCYGLIT